MPFMSCFMSMEVDADASLFIMGHQAPSFMSACEPSFFIIGQHAPPSIFSGLPSASFFIIGHDSASPLQQSASQQDIVVSLPDASFVVIGHESPLQQQQDAAAADVDADVPYEYATMAIPKTSAADITTSIFFFM